MPISSGDDFHRSDLSEIRTSRTVWIPRSNYELSDYQYWTIHHSSCSTHSPSHRKTLLVFPSVSSVVFLLFESASWQLSRYHLLPGQADVAGQYFSTIVSIECFPRQWLLFIRIRSPREIIQKPTLDRESTLSQGDLLVSECKCRHANDSIVVSC